MTNGLTSLAHPAAENRARFTTLDPAAGSDPKVAARIREAAEIADGFTPILYELRNSVVAPGA